MTELQGFGGVKFSYPNSTSPQIEVEFSGAYGVVEYTPRVEYKENDDGDRIPRPDGFNADVFTQFLYNIETDDIDKYVDFASILNLLMNKNTDNTVTIQPKYNSSFTNVSFECFLLSKVKIEEIARVQCAQVIKELKWAVQDKLDNISTITHTAAENITDGTNPITDEATDNITDG